MSQQQPSSRTAHANWTTRFAATLLALTALPATAQNAPAEFTPDELRVVQAIGKFGDTHQIAAAYRFRAPRPLRAHHLEVAVGAIISDTNTSPFLSVGPVWRFPIASGRQYVDFGFSPTVLSGSRFNGRELGGGFHFTSSLSLGMRLGVEERFSLALRAQHTSNGGLNSENPGLDMVGLNVAFEF